MAKVYIVVAYDVVSDRRRRRLAEKLSRWIERVQKSVFEGPCDERKTQELERIVAKEIDLETDGVRVYRLCARCREATEILGQGPLLQEEDEDVVV